MKCILGIDPGLHGALAFYFPEHACHISVHDMPLVDNEISAPLLMLLVEQIRPDVAFLEKVNAMPSLPSKPGGKRREMGATSAFNFGRGYGTVVGVIQALRIPLTLVMPHVWKAHFKLDRDKEKSRSLALATFTNAPQHFTLKKHADRAEAALIALYGARQISNGLIQAGGATGGTPVPPLLPEQSIAAGQPV